jgi:pimeloyl-ACP methyl ester carboxylesterase
LNTRKLVYVLGVLLAGTAACTQPAPQKSDAKPAATAAVKYGSNPAAGKTFTHNGVKLYYEVYGTGEPLLLIHGNGGSIADFKAQIEYFQRSYQVIAMDSRDQGKSDDSPDKITYEKMSDDQAALLEELKLPPVNVVGWSDGGIEALLLGMRNPDRVKKLVAMAANLTPKDLYPETIAMIKQFEDSLPAADKRTPQEKREFKVLNMMFDEPQIPLKALEKITAPTLVLASDHDLIPDEHTLDIYHHIPNSQLAILPNATHMVPYDDPELFNSTIDRFLRAPFVKKDRVKDFMKSYEAMGASQK